MGHTIVKSDILVEDDRSITIICPSNDPIIYSLTRAPVVRVTKTEIHHPFLRPFKKFFLSGKPEIGFVRYIMVQTSMHPFPAVIGSISWLPKSCRVFIYPGWGPGVLNKLNSKDEVVLEGMPVDHITREPSHKNNDILNGSTHFTSINRSKKKTKIWPSTSLTLKDDKSIHWGRLQVREPKVLDPAGIVSMKLEESFYKKPDEIRKIFSTAIFGEHPVLLLYGNKPWANGRLLVDFLLIKGRLEDRDYPRLGISPVGRESLTRIALGGSESLSLLVRLQNDNVALRRAFYWENKR